MAPVKKHHGFTLVELMIAMAIAGIILAAIFMTFALTTGTVKQGPPALICRRLGPAVSRWPHSFSPVQSRLALPRSSGLAH